MEYLEPPLLFTDGAFEPLDGEGGTAGNGGVLLDPADMSYHFVMWILPAEVMALFKERQNPIHQLELLPVLIASLLWKERIRGRAL